MKPCPFCGSRPKVIQQQVCCVNMRCAINPHTRVLCDPDRSRAMKAIKAWDTRITEAGGQLSAQDDQADAHLGAQKALQVLSKFVKTVRAESRKNLSALGKPLRKTK